MAESLRGGGIASDSQKQIYLPDTTVAVADEAITVQVLKLHDTLEAYDDIQNVYFNFDIPEETLAQLSA